jgi:hypothetical protein
LARKISKWAEPNLDGAKEIEPMMPDELNDREQDKHEPLFIVALLADRPVTDVTAATDVTDDFGWILDWKHPKSAARSEPRLSPVLCKTQFNGAGG